MTYGTHLCTVRPSSRRLASVQRFAAVTISNHGVRFVQLKLGDLRATIVRRRREA